MDGDTGGVNLHVRGVSKHCTLAVALNGSGAVAAHGVGREEIGVAITAGSDDNGIGREALQLARRQVLGNDTTGAAVDDDHVFHLIAGEELHLAGLHLSTQRRVGTEQQLLTGLTLGVERTANLSATERTVGKHTAVLTGEGNALSDALVDNIVADLCQTVDISLAGTIVTTLHRVVEQAVDGVTIVLIALGGVDTTLSGDRVRTTGRVLNAEIIHVEAHLSERSGGRGTSQAGTDNDDVELQLVLRVDKTLMSLIFLPFLRYGTCGNL